MNTPLPPIPKNVIAFLKHLQDTPRYKAELKDLDEMSEPTKQAVLLMEYNGYIRLLDGVVGPLRVPSGTKIARLTEAAERLLALE